MKKNCAFQYYDGRHMRVDKTLLTLDEAKELWNKNYDDMVQKTKDGEEIEVAIWINMKYESNYHKTLVHLSAPGVKNGRLSEPKYYGKF